MKNHEDQPISISLLCLAVNVGDYEIVEALINMRYYDNIENGSKGDEKRRTPL